LSDSPESPTPLPHLNASYAAAPSRKGFQVDEPLALPLRSLRVTAFPTALVKLVVYEDEHRLTGSHRHGHEEARPLT